MSKRNRGPTRLKRTSRGSPSNDFKNGDLTQEDYQEPLLPAVSLEDHDVQVSLLTGTTLFVLYLCTLHPSLPGGDSGELIISAYEFGVAHPPGYPLFTILSRLFISLVPFGSPAWRVNFLCALCGAVAGAFLQIATYRITSCLGSSLLSVCLFSLSRLTWYWSVTAEVFAFNNALAGALLFLAVTFDRTTDSIELLRLAYVGALVSGLSLCNQHTIIFYVAVIVLWSLTKLLKCHLLNRSSLLKLLACFLLGLTPYLYLPLSSAWNAARWTWGDQTTLTGFLTHVLRREYGTFDLGKEQIGQGFIHGLSHYYQHTQLAFFHYGPYLALVAVVVGFKRWLYRENGGILWIMFLMFILYVCLFAWRANLDLDDQLLKSVVERFWMQSDLVLSILTATGCHLVLRWLVKTSLGESKLPLASVFGLIVAAAVLVLRLRNTSECDQSRNYVVHDFAVTLLRNFPENSIVFTKGDLPTNSMRYFHLCEGARPDVEFFDVEVLTYSWSLRMLRKFYKRAKFPGRKWGLSNLPDGRMFNFKALLDANYDRYPLFACINMQDRDPSWTDSYEVLPFGVCSRIVRSTEDVDSDDWANVTSTYADDWFYPSYMFSKASWEKIANDEMWNAKIATAFYMYGEAERISDKRRKAALLANSYELYMRAIKTNQPDRRTRPSSLAGGGSEELFPSFWHKNFALVCTRLLHFSIGEDPRIPKRSLLCQQAVYHFEHYLQLTAWNLEPDAPKIQDAVKELKKQLDTYELLDRADRHTEKLLNRMSP